MKILIIGSRGQLGSDLCQVFPGTELIPLDQPDIEVTDMGSVQKALLKYRPEVVINTAALVRVDDCETEKDKAFSVNALGARNVAVVCQEIGAKLIFLSTDYIFGGGTKNAGVPYNEFDIPVPLSVYGASKLAGEKLVCHLCQKYFIVRTSGLFGVAGALGKGGNFIETVLKLAKTKNELTIVNDQVFSPTYSRDLARKIAQISSTEFYGVFHITNSGFCSWFEFSQEIVKLAGLKTPVIPVTSDQYPQKAKRPNYSVLENYHLHLLGLDDMRHWKEALADYLRQKGYSP